LERSPTRSPRIAGRLVARPDAGPAGRRGTRCARVRLVGARGPRAPTSPRWGGCSRG
jgi:hypothetical protein